MDIKDFTIPIQKPRGLDNLVKQAKQLGAIEGAKRLEFIQSQYKQLTPYTAHLWLNPEAVQEEIEEAQANLWWLQTIHFFRNLFSLLPLIVTWGALFDAANGYQQDLLRNPSDNTIPFLQLWQSGFNGFSRFTFTWAAATDVTLLTAYLLCIVSIHIIEHRAHIRAVEFIDSEDWRASVQELMAEIDGASRPFIADKSDIETVVGSISQVITEATTALKTAVNETAGNVKQAANQMVEANKQVANQMVEANKQVIGQTEQSIKTFITDTQQSLNQTINTSEQAIKQLFQASEQAVTKVLDLSQQSITESNQRVETLFEVQVKPLIEAFRQDVTTLQKELSNYQGRLDTLMQASESLAKSGLSLANASHVLEENAERYVTIGQDLKTQIAALNGSQQEMASQIGSVASNMSTATGNITDSSANMVAAIQEVQSLTQQIDRKMQTTTNSMSTYMKNMEKASLSLGKFAPPLEAASDRLYMASNNLLASIQQPSSPSHEKSSPRGKKKKILGIFPVKQSEGSKDKARG